MNTDSQNEWRPAPLRSVCLKTALWNPVREKRDSFRYIDVSAVSNESFRIESSTPTRGAEAPSRARKIVRKDDVIFATVRPSLQRVALVGKDYDNQIASTAFCVVRADPAKADARFLYFKLLTEEFLQQVCEFERGASYPAVTDKDILDREVSLPRFPEQHRIAAVLGKVQRAVELEAAQERAARELKQAVMRQLFTRGLHNEPLRDTPLGPLPESWEVRKIGSFASVSSGGTPLRSVEEYWNGGTIPWVKTGEINYGVIAETEEKITEAGMRNSAARSYPKGTLLMAMYGQGITRGKVAILGIEATTNQACAAIIQKSDVSTGFLFCYLAFAYERIRELGHGANQKNLSGELIADIEVPVPSDDTEQREIAAILGTLDRKIALHAARRRARQDLFRSTLHALMTARLRVPESFDHFAAVGKMMSAPRRKS
jgi:type I restriction enzyme S subunit